MVTINKIILFLIISLFIFSCTVIPVKVDLPLKNIISKQGIVQRNAMESSPFVWTDGKMYYLYSDRLQTDNLIIKNFKNISGFDSGIEGVVQVGVGYLIDDHGR